MLSNHHIFISMCLKRGEAEKKTIIMMLLSKNMSLICNKLLYIEKNRKKLGTSYHPESSFPTNLYTPGKIYCYKEP